MRTIIADTFTSSLARLTGDEQALAKQAAFDLQVDPKGPGMQFHRIERAKDKGFWSCRASRDIRIIAHKKDDTLLLCYVGHHDPAYAWAENRRLEVHPQTGAAQMVEIVERKEEVIKRIPRLESADPPLFGNYSEEYILALGVPEEWLPAVKTVTEQNLDALVERLPSEAGERLYQVALGEPVAIPARGPRIDPFSHPDAQRRFRVVDSQDELRSALDAPWEKWIIFLHPSQRSLVERRFSGSARLSGSAGTGKSVVALHRAAELLRRGSGRVLLTTFSKTLAARLSRNFDLLPGTKELRGRLDIKHLHLVAKELWTVGHGRLNICSGKDLDGILNAAREKVAPANAPPVTFIRSEWTAIVDARGISGWDDYRAVSRAGRTVALGVRQRQALWLIFAEVLRDLATRDATTWNRLCHGAAAMVKDKAPYAHVIADESQDFGHAELTLLRALVPRGPDDLFLCSDAGQRIYKAPAPWTAAGVDTRGRSARLKINYRTTGEICTFADGLMPEGIDEGDGVEKRSTICILSGPSPEIHSFESVSAEIDGLAAWLKEIVASGISANEIGVFARTEGVLRTRVEKALKVAGLPYQNLTDEGAAETAGASIGTTHRAKGLEFRAVAVVGCDAELFPLGAVRREIDDDADRAAFDEQERQLLYVASTRARERLWMGHTGNPSRFLATRRVSNSERRRERGDGS